MQRLTAHVSGQIQRVGYRARVVDMARLLGLGGTIQNLADGRVKIIAEGEENDLERFLRAIDVKNTIIHVSDISKECSEATGDFEDFYKLVGPGETDSRLDTAAVHLKELIAAVNRMNDNLGGKIDGMGGKIDGLGDKIDGLGGKIDGLGDKIDGIGGKIDDARADIVGEIRELRRDIKEEELVRMKNDIAEIKAKLGL